jgi:hypothetical protein
MISLGTDFVAGRNRVPSPATGKMAFDTFLSMTLPSILKIDAITADMDDIKTENVKFLLAGLASLHKELNRAPFL